MFARGSGQQQLKHDYVRGFVSILIMRAYHNRYVFCRLGNDMQSGHLWNLSSEFRLGCNIAALRIYWCKWLLICYGIKSVFRFCIRFCFGHIFRKLILHILPSMHEYLYTEFCWRLYCLRLFSLYLLQKQSLQVCRQFQKYDVFRLCHCELQYNTAHL